MRVVLDTNVFVVGFIDLAEGKNSAEVFILKELLKKEMIILLSSSLEEQIMRVILRVKDKNFAGLIRHTLWSDFLVKFVVLEQLQREIMSFKDKIPRKDMGIFLTAIIGQADYLISNDTDFLKKALLCQKKMKCVTPDHFISEMKKFSSP